MKGHGAMADSASKHFPATKQAEALPHANQAAVAIGIGVLGSFVAGPVGALAGMASGAGISAAYPYLKRIWDSHHGQPDPQL
jgi:hypothetical protein